MISFSKIAGRFFFFLIASRFLLQSWFILKFFLKICSLLLADYLMCSVLMKFFFFFLRNWVCAVHDFCSVLYIFADFSLEFWSNICAPPTTYCRASPSNSISKAPSHIYNLCWLFIHVQKQSSSMIAVISICSVLMIFFLLRNWVCAIYFLPRMKKELLLLSVLYIFLGQRLCV